MSDKRFEIEIVLFNGSPESTELLRFTPSSVEHQLSQLPQTPSFVRIAALEGQVGLGHFQLWSNGKRALIRLGRQPEPLPHGASSGAFDKGYVAFLNTDGSAELEPYENTISLRTAFDTLARWLRAPKQAPTLAWR